MLNPRSLLGFGQYNRVKICFNIRYENMQKLLKIRDKRFRWPFITAEHALSRSPCIRR